MIKIAVCDDEKKVLEEVSLYIEEYMKKAKKNEVEVFCFQSVEELISSLEQKRTFDIYMLDVYIGAELGTRLAKDLRRKGIESPIIFLTSSLEHAPQSFEVGTLRYLMKPLDPIKFYEAMEVGIAAAEKTKEKLIKFSIGKEIECISVNHIIYTEAHAHYQYITLEGEKQIRVRMTVAELFTKLIRYGGFIRVGSAYILNLRNIKNVSASEVHFYNDIHVNIPRGKHTEIKKAFWEFQYESSGVMSSEK